MDDLPAVWRATNYVLAQANRPEMTLDQFRAEFCLPFSIFYARHVPGAAMSQLEFSFHSRFRRFRIPSANCRMLAAFSISAAPRASACSS